MKMVCPKTNCSACGACVNICSKNAISLTDHETHYNAVINEDKCVNCGLCEKVCHINNRPGTHKPIFWKQGWVKDPDIRSRSSSGGAAAAIQQAFVKNGGCVCSCVFENGKFTFAFADELDEIKRFAGSKYVKSYPGDIYRQVRERLKKGKPVLFVGLPCQVAAVRNYVGEGLAEKLFTVDLICHGTPSVSILEIYLSQYGISLGDTEKISFRNNNNYQVENSIKKLAPSGVKDRYTLAFLDGLSYTDNCFDCKYASIERVSDITLGDSWGSELSEEEKAKGISLILVQTEKGKQLLSAAQLHLEEVDINRAIAHNGQLDHPTPVPNRREEFLKQLQSGTFNKAVQKCLPKQCFKQDLKSILIRTKLKK